MLIDELQIIKQKTRTTNSISFSKMDIANIYGYYGRKKIRLLILKSLIDQFIIMYERGEGTGSNQQ